MKIQIPNFILMLVASSLVGANLQALHTIPLQKEKQSVCTIAQNNIIIKEVPTIIQPSATGVSVTHLRDIIMHTMQYMQVPNVGDWRRLLMITALQETHGGKWLRQIRGPANGLMQVEPETERVALRWLARHDPQKYALLRKLRVPARLGAHEMQYNHAYCIAVAYAVYRMRHVNPSGCSVERLARLYKQHYNTARGKATVTGVLERVKGVIL